MSDAEMDYRFGWRWLLPMSGIGAARLIGFEPSEKDFWAELISSAGSRVEGSHADLLMVNASGAGTAVSPDSIGVDSATVACVLAGWADGRRWRGVLQQRFARVREYALLPAGRPRVVVPLDSRRHTVQALDLHRPGRRLARAGLWLARRLARLGNRWLLRKRVLLVATKDPNATPDGMPAGVTSWRSGPTTDYALYLGTPDDNRKTVVLPFGPGVSDVLLKVGSTAKARAALRNEAAALKLLAASPLGERVPKLFGLVEAEDRLTLIQEYRRRRRASRREMAQAVVGFLVDLAAVEHGRRPASEWLGSLPAGAQDTCPVLWQHLGSPAEQGADIQVHRSHGDFAPWNCAWTDRGLFVFDWEESSACELALSDAFYFAAAPALHVGRRANANRTLARILSLAAPVAEAIGLSEEDVRCHLGLWLAQRSTRSALYSELLKLLERTWR